MAMINYPTNGYNYSANATPPVTTPVVWVESEMEARNAYVAPGSTGFFMERQNPRFYVKSSTLSGEIASFKVFEFNEITPAPPVQPIDSQYVTTDTFNKTMDELKQMISQMSYRSNRNKERLINEQ